jgi:nucleotide-binding universal stress UspA family protein
MAIKDIFLPLVGEPDAAAIAAIDKCVAVAGDLGARVTAMAVEEDIPIRPAVMISNDLDNTGAALANHLEEHGIKATVATVAIDDSSVGKVFEAYVKANAIDLLVMGAYRHSRLNEMVWGGATKTVIGRPPCWVMMSR